MEEEEVAGGASNKAVSDIHMALTQFLS